MHFPPLMNAWYNTGMVFLIGILTVFSTFLGGLFAIKRQDKLHLILGFSAGAVVGVAFFDLLPEALALAGDRYSISLVTTIVAIGFLLFMFLSRVCLLHPHVHEESPEPENHSGELGASSLSIHSFLDGLGIGLAFQVSPQVGAVVAAAVLTHDFSDGINTVSFVLKHQGSDKKAMRWLVVDAFAPLLGIVTTRFFSLPTYQLGLVLSLFCGFFLYIGASDLLPESHHRHPKLSTSLMTILGASLIYLVIHLAAI